MDIEWAEKDDKIYVLQARAITTLKESDVHGKVTSEQPLCDETKEEVKIKISKMMKKNLAFTLEHAPYAYYPLDYEVAMILAEEKQKLFKEIGVNIGGQFKIDEYGVVRLYGNKTRINKNIIHIVRTIKEYTDIDKNKKKGQALLEECSSQLNNIESMDFKGKSLIDCGNILKKLYDIQKNIGYARFRYYIFPAVIIGKKLNRYLKGKYTEYDILSDLPYRTWQINEDLKELAGELKSYFDKNSRHNECEEDISEEYHKFKNEKIEKYLKKHGYKSDYNCYPFSGKSWNEDRNGFKEILNVAIKGADNKISDIKHYGIVDTSISSNKDGIGDIESNTSRKKYNDVIEVLKKNSGRKQRKVLESVEYYRECHIYREESQYMWEKCYALFRKVLTEISKILEIDIKDLWYLKFSELLNICEKAGIGNEDREEIKNRKVHRGEAESYWNTLKSLVSDSGNEDNVFNGVTGNGGVQSGHACVILGKEDFGKLNKGDILICSCTSPEWTPLFSLASAVVSDTGGALSHAAIVAREYGIPAVLGTGNATTEIHDGDNVLVDGNKGRVIFLNAE